jgi:hypothetical protein
MQRLHFSIGAIALSLCLQGCGRYSFECLELEAIEYRYGGVVDSLIAGAEPNLSGFPEVYIAEHERRVLTLEQREQALRERRIRPDSPGPQHAAEFLAAPARIDERYSFSIWGTRDMSSYYEGPPRGHPLHGRGIYRGWVKVEGVRHDIVAYHAYYRASQEEFGRAKIIASYPLLTERTACGDR